MPICWQNSANVGPALLDRQKLGAQIGKFSSALDPQVAGTQFCRDVGQHTELECCTVEDEALALRRQNEALPALAGEGERDRRWQRCRAAATILQDIAQGALDGVILRGGVHAERLQQRQQGGSQRGVLTRQEGKIVVAIILHDGGAQGLHRFRAAGILKTLANTLPKARIVALVQARLRNRSQGGDQRLHRLPLRGAQRVQRLFATGMQGSDALQEHRHQRITCRDLLVVDQTEHDRLPLGGREGGGRRRVQRTRFGRPVRNLRGWDALQQARRIAEGVEPGQMGEPRLEMARRHALGARLEPGVS